MIRLIFYCLWTQNNAKGRASCISKIIITKQLSKLPVNIYTSYSFQDSLVIHILPISQCHKRAQNPGFASLRGTQAFLLPMNWLVSLANSMGRWSRGYDVALTSADDRHQYQTGHQGPGESLIPRSPQEATK